jgi:hypothetical protein
VSKVGSRKSNDGRVVLSAGLTYLPNDPETPDLTEEIPIPTMPSPSPEVTVVGLRPGLPLMPGSPEYQASQVYAAMAFALHVAQDSLPVPLSTWAAVGNLVAIPRAGEQLNALYDRSSLRFFHWTNRTTNKVKYTCESADVVTHETGHAILDAIRPELWNMQALEVMAFHEAFGDCLAILSTLQHKSVAARVLKEAGPELKNSNVASRIAEELGAGIAAMGGVASATSLRDAVNQFTYVPPEDLPERATADKLSRDPHRFGQVFLGAFWDLLAELHRRALGSAKKPEDALAFARVRAAKLLFIAAMKAKARPKFMASMARAMVAAEKETFKGEHAGAIAGVFNARGLITDVPFAAQHGSDGLDPVLPGQDSQKMKVHVPSGTAKAFMAAAEGSHHEEAEVDCNLAVQSVIARGLVGGFDAMFMVAGEHLVRNYICQRDAWDASA